MIAVIDGSYLIYRGIATFSALEANGVKTGGLYGFLKTLLKAWRSFNKPTLIVCWDSGKTYRREMYPEYKAHRRSDPKIKEMSDTAIAQIALVSEVLRHLAIRQARAERYEADDVMATIASRLSAKADVVIASADSDLSQCVADRVRWCRLDEDMDLLEADDVKRLFGVDPEQIPDLKALAGDKSDGYPGIRGIGVQRAAALLREHGGRLEGVLSSTSDERYAKSVRAHADDARLFLKLATVVRNVPVTVDPGVRNLKAFDKFVERYRIFSLLNAANYRDLMEMAG